MHLLFLNHNYRNEGTFYRARPMAEQMARRGHRVTLLTVGRGRKARPAWSVEKGVRVGEMPDWGQPRGVEGYGPWDCHLRAAHALLGRYDVIHMFDHKPNATFPAFAGRTSGARLVADWADWWGGPGGVNDVPRRRFPLVGRFEAWWEIRSKLWADGVVAISTVLRDRAIGLGIPPDRAIHLPTGADLDRIRPLPIAPARRALGLPEDLHVLGFIGMGQGDLDTVFAALRQLPGVRLMVIGKQHPGVTTQARSYGVADRVWQTGFVRDEEVATYLACADVMCLPMTDRAADRGRLPNKLLDYLAAGRPTVAGPVGDVRTLLEARPVGLLADRSGFAPALAALLDDADRRARMGAEARRVAESSYRWDDLAVRLEAFYRSL